MRLQLYKTDTKESPWDYYHILDADWWINGIKTFHPTSQQQNQ